MRKFFKDYREYQKNKNELCKVWYKKHWKGTVLINVLAIFVIFGWFAYKVIEEKTDNINGSNEETEA